jgi:hypothetical protein
LWWRLAETLSSEGEVPKANTEILELCSRMTIYTHPSVAWMGHPVRWLT